MSTEQGSGVAGEEAIESLADAAPGELARLVDDMFAANQAVKLLIDPTSGAIVDASPAAALFYGYSREQPRSRASLRRALAYGPPGARWPGPTTRRYP